MVFEIQLRIYDGGKKLITRTFILCLASTGRDNVAMETADELGSPLFVLAHFCSKSWPNFRLTDLQMVIKRLLSYKRTFKNSIVLRQAQQ